MLSFACIHTNGFSQAASYNIDFGTVSDDLFNSTNGTSNFFNPYMNTLTNKNNFGTFYLNGGIILPSGGSMGLIQNSAASSSSTTPYNAPYYASNFGSGSKFFMRGAPSATSSNKFAVYRYNAATTSMVFQTDFYINLVNNANAQGDIVFLLGNQNDNGTFTFARDNMTSNTQVQDQQIFMGLKIAINNSATSATFWNGSSQSWVVDPTANASLLSALTQGKHSMTIVANNNPVAGATNGNVVYTFGGITKTLTSQKYDIYIDGVQVISSGTTRGGITTNLTLDAFCFNTGFNSNAGNFTLVLDNIKYTVNANSVVLLPVAMSDIKGKAMVDNTVSLSWTTLSETGNRGFRIERQLDLNGKFETLGYVPSKTNDGTSSTSLNYTFVDHQPSKMNIYRLAQEDFNGQKTYSPLIKVAMADATKSLIYPNPSTGSFTLTRNIGLQKMNIQILDATGKLVKRADNISDPNYKATISKAGIYTVKVTYPETGEVSSQRIVIQK